MKISLIVLRAKQSAVDFWLKEIEPGLKETDIYIVNNGWAMLSGLSSMLTAGAVLAAVYHRYPLLVALATGIIVANAMALVTTLIFLVRTRPNVL